MNSVYNTPKIKQNDNHQISLDIVHLLVDMDHAQPAGMLQQVFVVGQVVLFEDAAVEKVKDIAEASGRSELADFRIVLFPRRDEEIVVAGFTEAVLAE